MGKQRQWDKNYSPAEIGGSGGMSDMRSSKSGCKEKILGFSGEELPRTGERDSRLEPSRPEFGPCGTLSRPSLFSISIVIEGNGGDGVFSGSSVRLGTGLCGGVSVLRRF